MAEQRENYKGREIVLRSGADALAARSGDASVSGERGAAADEPELTIDGNRVFMVRISHRALLSTPSRLLWIWRKRSSIIKRRDDNHGYPKKSVQPDVG
jgi:hypothetical protein